MCCSAACPLCLTGTFLPQWNWRAPHQRRLSHPELGSCEHMSGAGHSLQIKSLTSLMSQDFCSYFDLNLKIRKNLNFYLRSSAAYASYAKDEPCSGDLGGGTDIQYVGFVKGDSVVTVYLASWASSRSFLAASICGAASFNTVELSDRFVARFLSSSSFFFRAAMLSGNLDFRIHSLTTWMWVRLDNGSVPTAGKIVKSKKLYE